METSATAAPRDLTELAAAVRSAVRRENMGALAALVHPTNGVRFSPYAYVDRGSDVVLQQHELPRVWDDATPRVWGAYDGSGDPIRLPFREYFRSFVSIPRIQDAEMATDRTLGAGNTPSNLSEAYPGAPFVEFHHPGSDPKFDGMDWQSVRFVFEAAGNRPSLIAVVHDQWTI